MASFPLSSNPSGRLISLRRRLLLALLVALYLLLWQGPDTLVGRTLFLVHFGLFLLWQPFVHAEQRLSIPSVLALTFFILTGTLFLKVWMLVLWIMMLAGIVGGKVLLFSARSARLFYLLALGFLVIALLLIAAPLAVPMARLPESFRFLGYGVLPTLLVVMVLLPKERETDKTHEVTDFIYSLFVFLILAVLMLGSLAAMLLFGSGYVEALLQALLMLGITMLLLGLAWNPHSGFSGIGGLFSRYLASIGMPVEEWLQALSDLALHEDDPQAFLEHACAEISVRLAWISGGEWVAGGNGGTFGETDDRRWEFSHSGMVLIFYTRHALSPTLIWHCNLLAQLVAQFHADKQRALALKHLSYMQAIHETGARLTHDVKNLLQSLNALCSAGIEPDAESSPEYQSLLRRQLPAITDRLADTLNKLSAPQDISTARWVVATDWWRDLQRRMAALGWLQFKTESPIEGKLPSEVFSGVADNLIRNVVKKHLRESSLRGQVELAPTVDGFDLVVCDNGSAISTEVAASLFVGPVSSESGYGIGLYHAARYALAAGYRLELAENRPGRVCFRLSPVITRAVGSP